LQMTPLSVSADRLAIDALLGGHAGRQMFDLGK
jgi:hypothetical protein